MHRLLLAILISFPITVSAAGHFTLSEGIRNAYQAVIRLQLPVADSLLSVASRQDPDNLLIPFVADYADFFRLYIREDESYYYDILYRKKARLRQIQSGDDSSPFYLFCQAEIHLHWAIARLKFREYVGAFADVRKAYQLLELNLQQHPGFALNRKSMGVLKAAIGAIPDQYRWGADLMGWEGTIDQGASYLKALHNSNDPVVRVFKPEITLLLSYLTLHLLQDRDGAWVQVNQPAYLQRDDLLAYFVKASIAMHVGRNDSVIAILERAPTDRRFEPFPFLQYMMGQAYSRKLDYRADDYYRQFLANFHGRNYRMEVWQKRAWLAWLRGDTEKYAYFLQQLQQESESDIDTDKAALEEAQKGYVHHHLLLKARLLFDGGYYTQALGLLQGLTTDNFVALHHKLELSYRLGRLYQAVGQSAKAVPFYLTTLSMDTGTNLYFAPNAALQLGLIYEQQQNKAAARRYYETCLTYKKHVYAQSLSTQAKAGLQRLDR